MSRLGLVHVVAVVQLSLKETGADKQGNQLTVEENHDCCSLHETLVLNELRLDRNVVAAVAAVVVVVERKQQKCGGGGGGGGKTIVM